METVKLHKAENQLNDCGVSTLIDNSTLYVVVNDIPLELAEFEIEFRAKIFDEDRGKP